MAPSESARGRRRRSAPRLRGDGPKTAEDLAGGTDCSLLAQGWSRAQGSWRRSSELLPAPCSLLPAPCSLLAWGWPLLERIRDDVGVLLPAPAGMAPRSRRSWRSALTAPCLRGDGPPQLWHLGSASICSPHPRGWPLGSHRTARGVRLLPAHAGMVPSSRAGKTAANSAPRARGDGPASATGSTNWNDCSPRTRGWSPTCPSCGLDGEVGVTADGSPVLLESSDPAAPLAAGCFPGLRRWPLYG
ncbi:hypothetical protein SAMN05428939_8111 [Streptomyces sp. TLI_105]|nr:hypothetical protein SAMN05428939_8111 [Streptomyces sp. TLI_105]